MKFLATLPSLHHYRPLQSSTEGVWLWEDKGTKGLRVRSPVPNPWEKQWAIVPSPQQQKSDRSEYPYRLVLRLYPPSEDAIPCAIEREEVKAVYAWANRFLRFQQRPLAGISQRSTSHLDFLFVLPQGGKMRLFLNRIIINGNGVFLEGEDVNEKKYHVFLHENSSSIPLHHEEVSLIDESNLIQTYGKALNLNGELFSVKP